MYSVNFGNYRDETDVGLDRLYFDPKIDYYFFTDNKNLRSKKWKIIYTEPIENDKAKMDKNRHTAKYFKFFTPEILKDYDILIWYDSKLLKKRRAFKYEKLVDKFTRLHKLELMNVKHRIRTSPVKELMTTIKNAEIQINDENPDEGKEFLKILKQTEFKIPLLDTECIVRKNNERINNIFKQVYDILIEKGLKRDQSVYNYILEKNKIYENFKYLVYTECG